MLRTSLKVNTTPAACTVLQAEETLLVLLRHVMAHMLAATMAGERVVAGDSESAPAYLSQTPYAKQDAATAMKAMKSGAVALLTCMLNKNLEDTCAIMDRIFGVEDFDVDTEGLRLMFSDDTGTFITDTQWEAVMTVAIDKDYRHLVRVCGGNTCSEWMIRAAVRAGRSQMLTAMLRSDATAEPCIENLYTAIDNHDMATLRALMAWRTPAAALGTPGDDGSVTQVCVRYFDDVPVTPGSQWSEVVDASHLSGARDMDTGHVVGADGTAGPQSVPGIALDYSVLHACIRADNAEAFEYFLTHTFLICVSAPTGPIDAAGAELRPDAIWTSHVAFRINVERLMSHMDDRISIVIMRALSRHLSGLERDMGKEAVERIHHYPALYSDAS